jgi:hypothetical protein
MAVRGKDSHRKRAACRAEKPQRSVTLPRRKLSPLVLAAGRLRRRIWTRRLRARLRFDAMRQIAEWRGSDNPPRDTAELFRQAKGKRRKSEAERRDDKARHLSIRGGGGLPERMQRSTVPSEGE